MLAAQQDLQQLGRGHVFVGNADGYAAQFFHRELGIQAYALGSGLSGEAESADRLIVFLQTEYVGKVGRSGVQFAVGKGVAQLARGCLPQLDAPSRHVEVEGFGFQIRHTADFYGHGFATAVFNMIGNCPRPCGLHEGALRM